MDSSNVIPSFLSGGDEDILASLLDIVPSPNNFYCSLDLSDPLSPPGNNNNCLLLGPLDRELEDEGFEDCIEEEDNTALQRDSDPSLASSTIPLNSINKNGLESFFPLDLDHQLITPKNNDIINNDDVFVMTDELFEMDQGVAMEASELPLATCNSDNNLHDVSFYNTPPPSCPSPFFTFPSHSPSHSSTNNNNGAVPLYGYTSSPPPPLISTNNSVSSDLTLTPTNTINNRGEMGELDYLYTFLQSPITHDNGMTPNLLAPHPPSHQYDKIDMSCINSQQHRLNDTTTLVANDNNTLHQTSPSLIDYNFMNIQTQHNLPLNPTSGASNTQSHVTPSNNGTISLETINSLSLLTAANNSSWQPPTHTTDFRNNLDRGSQTERRRSPSPHQQIPPSPTSSVNTDYPENEFNKDLASPDVPHSLSGYNKSDIVDMPFYEFKKLVDSNSISERDKDEVKAIRKRGKNKMAAKNCRHRKLELLSSLQQDIDKLKGKKARLALKALSLQREIEGYKSRYTYTPSPQTSRSQQTMLTSTVTKVH